MLFACMRLLKCFFSSIMHVPRLVVSVLVLLLRVECWRLGSMRTSYFWCRCWYVLILLLVLWGLMRVVLCVADVVFGWNAVGQGGWSCDVRVLASGVSLLCL